MPGVSDFDFTLGQVEEALRYLNYEDRDTWVRMAMAIKVGFGDAGFDVWNQWSANGATYNETAARNVWRSVKLSGGKSTVTLGTLIHEARQAGFVLRAESLSNEEKEKRKAEAAARRKAYVERAEREAVEVAQNQATAAEFARALWGRLDESGASPYLDKKRVRAYGLRFVNQSFVIVNHAEPVRYEIIDGADNVRAFFDNRDPDLSFHYYKRGTVVVPVRDLDGEIINLQFITPNGTKKFLKHARKSGGFHYIRHEGSNGLFGIAEGYATAASVFLASGIQCAVAFDAGNLMPVARALCSLDKPERLLIFGDDDAETEGNPGRTKAEAVAREFGGVALLPNFREGASKARNDWNDLWCLEGIDEVCEQINTRLSNPQSEPEDHEPELVPEPLPEPPPVEMAPPDMFDSDEWRNSLEKNQYRKNKASLRNIELVLNNDNRWRDVLGFSEFSYSIIKRNKPPMKTSGVGEWNDADTAALRLWLAQNYGFTPGHSDIADALSVVSRQRPFHPVREFLRGLKWDGVPRLHNWLKLAFDSTESDEYIKVIGPKVLVGAVARVMRPGCKMDNVIILEGKQGKGKSTSIDYLFGEWFTDAPLPIGDKDAYMVIQGKWGLEIGELDAFHKAEVTALKHFFSQRIDRYRAAYGRVAQDHPRQTVFWATTNQDVYFRDYTGNRRFWPLYCAGVNPQWVLDNREQLWAEATVMFDQGYQWWVCRDTPEQEKEYEVVIEVQDSRLQRDTWEDKIAFWLDDNVQEYHTTGEILEKCIGAPAGAHQQQMQNRVGAIMNYLGWKNKRIRVPLKDGSKRQIRAWVKQNIDEKDFESLPL